MTLTRLYEATFQVGDGETKDFPFYFDEVSENFIRVIIKRADGSIYYPTFSVDMELLRVVFGEDEITPTADDVICIYRDTPTIQDTQFNTLQGYNAKALENILSKIVAMIQEMKANGFSTQILQGEPWSLDLIKPADDGASVQIDYQARVLKKGLYFKMSGGNLLASPDGVNFVQMPKSENVAEFRQYTDDEGHVHFEYRVGNVWFDAGSLAWEVAVTAEEKAEEALVIASGLDAKIDSLNTKVDDKFTVANAQIDANAEAIQKTREDYIEADSEIHQILNNHAGELTTLHNDVDNLGDQVSGIEEKIPETASAENPLVTRSEISSVYKFKGSVATYNDLPTGATVGDVYNVTDTGANYAWDGSAWDKLSETVDLSSYATTAYVNAREQDIRDDYMAADADLQTQINGQATAIAGNTDNITEINGKISSSASSTNKLISASELTAESQDIRSDYMAADSELQTQINGLSSAVATNQSNISTLRTDVGDLENQVEANHNDITAHIADTSNPHNVTKTQVGLGSVDNTSDLNKPVSTAQQTALNLKADKSTTYSKTEVDDLLVPKLDSETAEDTYATITNLNAHTSNTSNPHSVTKSQVGLGNVDNTSDLNKPVSTAQQTAINTAKQDVISGYTAADGELQQQINAHATAISTNTSNITALTTRVDTNETTIAFLDSDVDTINTDVATAKTDIANLKSSVNSQAGLIQGLQDDVSGKVDKNQGTANAGKILSVGSDGQVTLTSAPGGGLTAVAHDSTLTGTGADSSPLGIASTVLAKIADKAEQTTVETLSGVVSQNTTNIGTLRTDVDNLGGQVSGIESKIPESASSTNQLATKSEIPTVPTNISAFNNDSGYITSSALTPYATTQALNDGLATKQPAGDYATNSALTSGLALKVAIAQGSENAGKILKIDDSGNVIVADESGGASLPIFYHAWADHLLDDMSWLRADTFSWQSGDVYVAAYNHLASDIDGKTLQSERVNGVAISYYLADDGHKICMPNQASNVAAIYAATGVAWYYIIDTTNQRFKLPRTMFGFTGLRDGVGNYVEAGVPNITGDIIPTSAYSGVVATGAFYGTERSASTITNGGSGSAAGNTTIVGMSASLSSSVYGNSYTVQPPATEMYLYFYVGNFEQSAIEQTAGLNAELFNQKADLNLANSALTSQFAQLLLNAGIDTVIERQEPTAANNYTWYRKYKSGWVEQGGVTPTGSGAGTITLPVVMADNNYQFYGNPKNPTSNNASFTLQPRTLTTTTAGYYKSYSGGAAGEIFFWQVSGMAA